MSAQHLLVLAVYGALVLLSALIALAGRRVRPADGRGSVWRKYPTYIALNVAVLAAAWLPTAWHTLTIALALIAAGASWEVSRALRLNSAARGGLPIAAALLVLAADWAAPAAYLPLWLGVLLAASAVGALAGGREALGQRMLGLAAAIIYVPLCLAPLAWLWHMEGGGLRVALLYMLVASNDGFAQVIGQLVGGRRLAPAISPGKTVSGAVGGVACAAIVGAILSATIGWAPLTGALVGGVTGSAGLIGDLIESAWKRALGLKDFSGLLGAQGGVLDRFDSLLFAAPVFYLVSISLPG